jgi:hypothetical protein
MPPAPEDDLTGPPPPRRRRRRWLLRITLALVLSLIAGELFARYYLGLGDPALSQADPEIEYLFKPDQDCHPLGNHVRYNHYSMRSDDFPLHKTDPRELRVLVVGDSVVNGGSLTDQSKLATSLMQAKLSADLKRPVVVGNISAGSWGPPNEAAYLKRFGLFDADVLVIVLSSHDYIDVPTFEPTIDVLPGYPSHKPVSALWDGIHRYLLSRLNVDPLPPDTGTVKQADVDQCMAALREMIAAARANGGKVIVALHLGRDEPLRSPLPGHDVIAREAARAGVNVVELGVAYEAAPDRSALYRDPIHPSIAGQRVIGDVLTTAVENILRTPATTTTTAPGVTRAATAATGR